MQIRAIFWDVGGVLLSNAWDHTERSQALQHFNLNEQEFQGRHETLVPPFEQGKISLDEYLDQTIFYCPRPFTREAFKEYMFSLSQPKRDVLAFARELGASGKYFMATLNNESRDLNQYRIQTFGLREIFSVFVSSCFVSLRKPDPPIYRLALEITQKLPEECCFIDDRPPNLESPRQLGMHTIQMQGIEPLKRELLRLGVGSG